MKKNILIVDDDKRLRELLKDYLTEKNLQVYQSEDYDEAKEILSLVLFDLIILDRMMPSGDGIELIEYIKQFSNTPIIMLTAMGEDKDKIDGLKINLYGLPSVYWGQDQVVTGLLTGEDLINGLQNKDLGEGIYIPSIMLKINTDLFLDDKNIKEVENQLNTKIHVLDDSNDIINTLIG